MVSYLNNYAMAKLLGKCMFFLQESQWWDRKKLEEYQIQHYKELMNYGLGK